MDVGRLLRGHVELVPATEALAVSALTHDPAVVSSEELELALAIPEEWTPATEVLAGRDPEDGPRLEALTHKGVVLVDDDSGAELRRRDDALAEDHWSPGAAVYHFGAKWRDVQVDLGPEAGDDLPRLGTPPPHFVSTADETVRLPRPERRGELYDVLARRRTSRAFDRTRSLGVEKLAVILDAVWGAHGIAEFAPNVAMLRKTSPSGGGLHPIEVYPLVRDVEGLDPGLYHYNVEHHALELMAELSAAEAEGLAGEFTAGQTYFEGAHALFLMTGRFDRVFWKYRDHARAYMVLLMDAGHLSQTFYLVCTELGLGAFVTAAINGANIEERLGLDGYEQGAVLVCGCGPPGEAPPGLEPVFEPYPR